MTTTHTDVIPVTADDGTVLNLHHVTGERPATRGPVVLVHGAGVRANIFRPPGQTDAGRHAGRRRLGRVARELARQHRPAAHPMDARRGCGLRPPGPDPHRRGRDRGRLGESRRALSGLDQLCDVGGRRPAARGDDHRVERGLVAPADTRHLERQDPDLHASRGKAHVVPQPPMGIWTRRTCSPRSWWRSFG